MAEIYENVTFTVDGVDTVYIAERVNVTREWVGKRRRLADRTNIIFTDGYHLIFEIFSEDIEIESGTNKIRSLMTDLEDPAKTVTVKVKDQAHEVISDMNEEVVFETEFGTRRDSDIIRCITKDVVADLTEFEKA